MSERERQGTATNADGARERVRECLGRLKELLGLETPRVQPAYVPVIVRRLPRRRPR